MSNELNISLKSKSTPTINLQIGDEAKKIITSDASSPIVTFVATGEKGDQGIPGTAAIGSDSVTSTEILDGTITSAQIQNFTISTNDIGAQQITSAKIGTGAVTRSKISNDAVDGTKLADNSVGAEHIVDGTIVKELINDLELTSEKFADGSITTIKVAENAITKAKILDKTITGQEIQDNVVLGGIVHAVGMTIDGESPGYLRGPADDIFYIQSHNDLIFVCDSDQTSNPDVCHFRFQNAGGSNLLVIDESGNTTLSGNLDITGNITISGTVDGVDVNTALTTTTAQQLKMAYITVTQPVNLDTIESNVATNNSKTSFPGFGTTAGTALEGNTTIPTVPTLIDSDTMSGASSSNIASAESIKAYVDNEVAGIVDSAPGTLNTLNELAAALGDDENFSTTVTNNIATKQPILSEGAFANGDKTKLDGIATGATASPDLTVDGAGTVHSNNYTDTNTNIANTDLTFTSNRTLDMDGGDLTFNNGANVLFQASEFDVSSSSQNKIQIINTGNNADGSILRFVKNKGAAGADNDVSGQIEFYADDSAQQQTLFARIRGVVKDASNAAEEGKLAFAVASHDGEIVNGLIIESGNTEDKVNLTLGSTTGSVINITGELNVAKKLDIQGDNGDSIRFDADSSHILDQNDEVLMTFIDTGVSALNAASDLDIGSYDFKAQTFTSDVATGTAPFTVSSTTAVANLQAATATTLHTARNIGGVSFNGSANIDLPGVNTAGNQDTTGNATTATNLTAGNKTIAGSVTSKGLIVDANVSVTPSGDGVALHVDAMDVTDNNTSASGTAAIYNHITFENPRLLASNSSVTTTNASTVYIKGAPVVGTNQTITNPWSLYVAAGNSYFAGAITASGGVTGDVTGNVSGSSGSCTGNAATATTATTATNLVASTSTAVELGTIELGHASDTTIARSAAGTVTIEGNTIATTNKLIDTKTAAYWSSSTSGFYITLSGSSTSENSSLSTASYTLMYVAPFDGKILRISSFHQNNASGTSTFEVYIDGDDSNLTTDQRGSDMTTAAFNRKFTEDCPADWTFSKGEAIAIKRTDSTARYGVTMTIVFEYDTTT